MKKIIYSLLAFVGFILLSCEAESTTPNVIGLAIFAFSIFSLDLNKGENLYNNTKK